MTSTFNIDWHKKPTTPYENQNGKVSACMNM